MGAQVESAVAALVARLRDLDSGVRWVRTANLHLTLRFLGDAVDRNLLAPLDQGLEQIGRQTAPFDIHAHGAGAFPNLNRPRTIWIGLAGDQLLQLAQLVEEVTVRAGFVAERRPYTPHLTIGRMRDLRGWPPIRDLLRDASNYDFGSASITEMILYRSIVGGEASQYLPLARYQLEGAPAVK